MHACFACRAENGLDACVRPLVASASFTVLGFFQKEDAIAHHAQAVFQEVTQRARSTWHGMAVGIVTEAPRPWLESAAIPDWVGIDCTFDSARWLIVVYRPPDDDRGVYAGPLSILSKLCRVLVVHHPAVQHHTFHPSHLRTPWQVSSNTRTLMFFTQVQEQHFTRMS